MKTKAKRWIWIAVAGCLSLLSVPCRAQSVCPWLNAATASGVLGGAATVEVSNPGVGTGTCIFHLQNGPAKATLRIAVMRADHPASAGKEMKPYEINCSSAGKPLKAVGNEAVLCVSNTKMSRGELVIGRVRDNIFTVAITSAGSDSEATPDTLAEKAEVIAKQVAGSLF